MAARPLAECSERLGIGRDGVTAQSIVRAARTLAFASGLFRPLHDFTHVPLPAIAHWNFDHFVVVERWSPKRADIIDPAKAAAV